MGKEIKPDRLPSSDWYCDDCKTAQMTHAEMLAHVHEVHKLEIKGLKATKKMLMHVDGSDFFTSTYEVTIEHPNGVLHLTHATWNPRKKNDPMGFP